jgi:hypothetical protein
MTNFHHLLAFLVCTSAFQVQPGGRTVKTSTALDMGLFDFKPVHGGGSGSSNDELEKQYKMQQELVRSNIFAFNGIPNESLIDIFSTGYCLSLIFVRKLKARRDHINFKSLHEKYSNNDKTTHESDVFSLGTEYKEDELAKSHVDDEGDNKSFPGRNILKKFPWNLKP